MSGDIIFGLHAVRAALERRPEKVREVWLDRGRDDRRLLEVAGRAERAGIVVHRIGREELDRKAPNARHQGVVAQAEPVQAGSESDLEHLLAALREPPFLLVLDGVQDPHNLGACLRSADAAGAHAVIAPRDRACSLTPVVRKVATGAAETVPFIQVTNLARTLRFLQGLGVWIVGADAAGEKLVYEADLAGPLALALGAEGQGLRRLTREHCDLLVRIPMHGAVESLNVAVAAGICLFEAVRQRGSTR